MQPVQIEATVGQGGTVTLSGLPFRDGEKVAISISLPPSQSRNTSSHPLEGLPIIYIDPFEPSIPPEEWETA
jgi:hypothetical protein